MQTVLSRTLRLLTPAVLGLLAFSVTPLTSEELPHTGAQVVIWVPDNWSQQGNEDSLMIMDPDQEVFVTFAHMGDYDLTRALELLEEELAGFIEEARSDDQGRRGQLNGMDVFQMSGSGKIKGSEVRLWIRILETPNRHAFLAVGVVPVSRIERHGETVRRILDAIRPL